MSKFMPLSQAVRENLHDGDSVAFEGFTHLIPHAAGHEAIRQGKKDLTLIRMTPDILYDQFIGMGLASTTGKLLMQIGIWMFDTAYACTPNFSPQLTARIAEREHVWAAEMNDLITELVGKGATLGLERLNAGTAIALGEFGLRIVDAQQPVEMARAIKSAEEVKCINASLRSVAKRHPGA